MSEQREEQSKDVCAGFGAVAVRVASFESNLTNILLLNARLNGRAPTEQDLDMIEEELHKKKVTLGGLIRKVAKEIVIPAPIQQLIDDALDRRNHLMHRFFYENAFEFETGKGRLKMLEDLKMTEAVVLSADKLTTTLTMDLAKHLGITSEVVRAEADALRQSMRQSEQACPAEC